MKNIAFAVVATMCAVTVSPAHAGEESIRLKEGTNRDITQARCAICHSLDYITMVAPVMNRASWEKTVRKMIDSFGAPVEEQAATQIIEYLGQQYSAEASQGERK